MKNLILILLCSGVLVACGTTTKKAPIEDRTALKAGAASKAEEGQLHYTVKKGDTLYRIALEHGQSYSDLIAWNSLANPHDIKVGQVLRVSPIETTSTTASTSAVASPSGMNGVSVRPLGSASAAPSSHHKNGPRADKRPYSEVALAELQKGEPTNVAPEKVPETPVADNIAWTWPADGKATSYFDDKKNKGVDFLGKTGQNVYAAAAGTVMYAGSGIRGYGNLVIIKHSNNFLSAYAHNQSILVKEKQVITKGQKIAEMGNSDSDVVKLHFEIRQQGKPVDPMKYLPSR
jgi:lipoprotein NlpD